VLISVSYVHLWRVVISDRANLKDGISEQILRKITKNYTLGIPLYLAAFGASFVSIYLAIGICTALWVFWCVTVKDL
jgi:uncharacterized protein YybS (DUF2232 family)